MNPSALPEAAWRDPVDELYSRPGFLIRRAHQIAVAVFLEAAGGVCTTTQYGALVVLRASSSLDQIGLSRLLGIDRSTTALVVGKLEAAGHLGRGADVNDRRRKHLQLTPQGERALEALAKPAAQARGAVLAALNPDQGDQLIHLLERFVATFNEAARAPIVLLSGTAQECGAGLGFPAAGGTLRSGVASPELATLYGRPGFLLRRAHQICVSLFLSETAARGVTTAQFGVLMILRHCEGLDQLDLSKMAGFDRTTTALVVRKLEEKGMAVRVADPADRRRKVIVLTGRGERMLASLREPAARARNWALSAFSPDDAELFLALLAKVVNHFNPTTRAPIHILKDAPLEPA